MLLPKKMQVEPGYECSGGRYCRYGSFMASGHPCNVNCKHQQKIMNKKEYNPTDRFSIAYDALRNIDLYSDVSDPAATAKDLGNIATNALHKIAEIDKKSYDWTKHGDFQQLYCKLQKRNYWLLGYFGGGAINIVEATTVAMQMAEATKLPLETIKMDEVLSSRRYKSFKFIYSELPDQEPLEGAQIWDNVYQHLTD